LTATVAVDRAAVKMAELKRRLHANSPRPFDGKTGPVLIQPGNIVTASATTPMVTIAQGFSR